MGNLTDSDVFNTSKMTEGGGGDNGYRAGLSNGPCGLPEM